VNARTWAIPCWLLACVAWLAVSGCQGSANGEVAGRLSPEEASARVSELLYGRNLIADPEVNAKVNEYVLAVSRDGVRADSVMPELHTWLAAWAERHPDRVAAAQLLLPAPVRQPESEATSGGGALVRPLESELKGETSTASPPQRR
jgi:hypothetical protein